jgi:hypothetical protein
MHHRIAQDELHASALQMNILHGGNMNKKQMLIMLIF